jgi:hypothetical protein
MAGESDEPDEAAARLEAALERIATAAARRAAVMQAEVQAASASSVAAPAADAPAAIDPEIAARLDGLIDRLRGALGARPG